MIICRRVGEKVGQAMCVNNAKGSESIMTKLVQRDGHQSKMLVLRKQSGERIKSVWENGGQGTVHKMQLKEQPQVENEEAKWGILEAQVWNPHDWDWKQWLISRLKGLLPARTEFRKVWWMEQGIFLSNLKINIFFFKKIFYF